MLQKFGLVVLLACLFTVTLGQVPPEPLKTTTEISTPDTPPAAPTTTPPASPTTTPAPPTTTTAAAPTTAPTVAPTSTAAPNTTVAPTSTAAPSTTAVPPTVPPATVGKWTVKGSDNVTCIIANLAIQVDVTFDVNKTDHWIFDVPSNASTHNSQCGNTSQSLVLSWMNSKNASLMLHFTKNGSTFELSQVVLSMALNSTTPVTVQNDVPEFSTPVSHSYRCAKDQEIKLMDKGNQTTAVVKINHVQWEAFHEKTDENFGAAEDCAGSTSPDIVPIAVGCALVGLVAIVLIAYLVGRRRSQARGYLSM